MLIVNTFHGCCSKRKQASNHLYEDINQDGHNTTVATNSLLIKYFSSAKSVVGDMSV